MDHYICCKFSKLNRGIKAKKLTGSLLLILFLGYFGSITLFSHTHHVENGRIIVHSHPFKSFPGKEPVRHSHSSESFILIQSINAYNATFSFSGFSGSAFLTSQRCLLVIPEKQDMPASDSLFSCSLRGPPQKYAIS